MQGGCYQPYTQKSKLRWLDINRKELDSSMLRRWSDVLMFREGMWFLLEIGVEFWSFGGWCLRRDGWVLKGIGW